MSHQDYVISNPMSSALATKFKHPSIVADDRGGFHVVPDESKVGTRMGFVRLDREGVVCVGACSIGSHQSLSTMRWASFAVYSCSGLVVAFDTEMCVHMCVCIYVCVCVVCVCVCVVL